MTEEFSPTNPAHPKYPNEQTRLIRAMRGYTIYATESGKIFNVPNEGAGVESEANPLSRVNNPSPTVSASDQSSRVRTIQHPDITE